MTATPPEQAPHRRAAPLSLTTRLLLAASLVLVGALGATGLILDTAFRASARTAVQDRLQGHIYTLLAAADILDDGQLFVPDSMPEPRFSRPGSGLYARIDGDGYEWSSPSVAGEAMDWPETTLAPGQQRFLGPLALNETRAFVLQLGIAWELESGERRFTIRAAESVAAFADQVSAFRRTLWLWLGAVAVGLLAVQGLVLRWSLRPLRSVSADLHQVERGDETTLAGRYPSELRGLTDHLNRFIRRERRTLQRYRNSLGDLAHSLKTPLAVLRSGAEGQETPDQTDVLTQVERMDDIVAYQLQRASTSGHLTFARPLPVIECVGPIVESLEKVHADKGVVCEFDIDETTQFFGERGDLMEVLGNLIENAFKWCHQRVVIGASSLPGGTRPGCRLWVDDDGPGMAPELSQELFQRGVRGDERVQGHGIGLSMVRDIVEAYDGRIAVSRAPINGARITITFPPMHDSSSLD